LLNILGSGVGILYIITTVNLLINSYLPLWYESETPSYSWQVLMYSEFKELLYLSPGFSTNISLLLNS